MPVVKQAKILHDTVVIPINNLMRGWLLLKSRFFHDIQRRQLYMYLHQLRSKACLTIYIVFSVWQFQCWLTWGVQFQSGEQQVRLRLFIQVSDVPDVTCSVTLSNDMVIELNL